MTTETEMKPGLFICRGREYVRGALMVNLECPDGKVRSWTDGKTSRSLSAGASYQIEYSDAGDGWVCRLSSAKYQGPIDSSDLRAQYQATDAAARLSERMAKREKKETKALGELRRLLLPARAAYQKTNHAGRTAMLAEVITILQTWPTDEELRGRELDW